MTARPDLRGADRAERTVYSTDNSVYQIVPDRVVVAMTPTDVERVLAENAASDEPMAVVARGGGTGTNGQSLTTGISLDLKRGLRGIIAIDVQQRTAVVQSGVVTGALNERLRPLGLEWAPHTSTVSRATVGGMIATDAAGKGSLVHGRSHRHVLALDVVLDDGTPFVAEPVTEAEARVRAGHGGRGGAVWQALLDLDLGDDVDLGLPELARGFSGYGIDRLRRDGLIDPVALFCGAEGTLGVVTAATLRLTELPSQAEMIVAYYGSFDDALVEATELRATAPMAIECFDEHTLAAGRASPAWRVLGDLVGDRSGAVLVLEYDGNVDAARAAIAAAGRALDVAQVSDPADQAAVWKVRADAVGLLGKVVVADGDLEARPTAFVEDCAVPVAAMPTFIAEFRALLDSAGLRYGMFGHADVGCVHVRPALDLRSEDHRRLVRDITEQARELVRSHGGVLWGEHGRGFRGSDIAQVLPAETIAVMRQVKAIFDPRDLLNPGKLYRPLGVDESLIHVDEPPFRGQADAQVPVVLRSKMASAFACNGNGLCHHYGAAQVMCPSYKATLDPALSPKGRADLLRAWSRAPGEDRAFEAAIADNLGQCLSCSACTGLCPVEVDIPELKSRFLEHVHEARRRPPTQHLMRHFESLARVAARVPGAGALSAVAGLALGLRDLPSPDRSGPPMPRPRARPGDDLVVLPDVFSGVLEPRLLVESIEVLEHLGYQVGVAPFLPSGKYEHVKGMRSAFRKRAERQLAAVDRVIESGATPVVIEPAVALLYQHEYPAILGEAWRHGDSVVPVATVIGRRIERLASSDDKATTVRLLGHCTERATSPQTASAWIDLLAAVGYGVETVDIGCCGMAGVFGHERENQELSRSVWDLSWASATEALGGTVLAVPGHSCRTQTQRFADVAAAHPITLLRRSLDEAKKSASNA